MILVLSHNRRVFNYILVTCSEVSSHVLLVPMVLHSAKLCHSSNSSTYLASICEELVSRSYAALNKSLKAA